MDVKVGNPPKIHTDVEVSLKENVMEKILGIQCMNLKEMLNLTKNLTPPRLPWATGQLEKNTKGPLHQTLLRERKFMDSTNRRHAQSNTV